MKWNSLLCLLFVLNFLKGTLPQGTSAVSLEGHPAYAVVGPGGNATGSLLCVANYDEDNPPHRSWMSEDTTLLTFDDEILETRHSASLTEAGNAYRFSLKLDPLLLTDEGKYICQISINKSNIKKTVNLHINQFPTNRITTLSTEVTEEETATVAACHADLSKPPPDMWFEDSFGNKIETGTVMMEKECGNGLSNYTLHLSKRFMREDMDEDFYCKISHVNYTEPKTLKVEQVNVLHPPTVRFVGEDLLNEPVLLQEGSLFSISCETTGYPKPTITWTFAPANKPEEMEDDTPAPTQLPSNFALTDDNRRLLTQSLQIADDGAQTNNGTFTCTASNGIGPDASASFTLQVFALPTTPPTTTTEEVTPAPRQAGPSAAVIAGVVAVAVFILIVTVILLLRYFMAHKGEYYTNELKSGEDGRNDLSEEDDLPTTEEELLGEKKRTEHFL